MINLKLKTIASLITKEDVVLDIGCDHAYLAIYLKEQNLCKEVYASDINEQALNNAIKNIKNHHLEIKTYLSDGFKRIDNDQINTAVISGVGTSTILSILEHAPNNIKKFIICSNNNHEELRKALYQKGLYNKKEIAIKEQNHFYIINLFTKEKTKENKKTLKYGKSNNKEYFRELLIKEEEILKNIPKNHRLERFRHYKKRKELKRIIKRN